MVGKFVLLTEKKHKTLLELHGKDKLEAMIERLDEYIEGKPEYAKIDHGSVMGRYGWVTEWYEKRQTNQASGKSNGRPKGFATYSDDNKIKAMAKTIKFVGDNEACS